MEVIKAWGNFFNSQCFHHLEATVASCVVNPIDNNEIIVTIRSYSFMNPNLFIFDTKHNTIDQITNKHPLGRCSNTILVANSCLQRQYKNKLIMIGESRRSQYFFCVLNVHKSIHNKTLIDFEDIKIGHGINYNNNKNYRKAITGNCDEMLGIDSQIVFFRDWIFASEDDYLSIFYLNKNTNYPHMITEIELKYRYQHHGMILFEKVGYLNILLFGSTRMQFKESYCLIQISIKSLKYMCENQDDQERVIYKVYYDNVISSKGVTPYMEQRHYSKFSFNFIKNRYLLLTGGEFCNVNDDSRVNLGTSIRPTSP